MNEKYKILHLEDRASDAELVARELKKSHIDFESLVIDSKEEYLNALEAFCPDIILCDHSLPSFNSLDAITILKAKKIDIPFILITATLTEDVAGGVMKVGAEDYILKDRLKRLPHAVINALEKYKFEKERKRLIDNTREKEEQSNKALRKLSDKLLLATKVAGIGIWEYDFTKGNFIFDDVLFSLYDATPEELDGDIEKWVKLIHPEDRERVRQQLLNTLTDNPALETGYRVVWKDGSVHYLKATAIVQKDSSGKPTQLIGTIQDITVSKLAEQAIKESEAKYRSFFENSMDGILLTAPEGKILAANPAACEIFNMTEKEICEAGRAGITDMTDPRFNHLINERRLVGKAKGEITFFRKDGSRFPGEVTSATFKDAYGIERTSIIIRDVTKRKQAEEKNATISRALQNALDDVKKIMDSSLDVICSIDKDGRFVSVSSASQPVWGYSPNELKGKKYMELVFEDDIQSTTKAARKITKGIPVTAFENRYIHKNGSIVPMMWSATYDNKEKLMYAVAKDVTEKKRLEKAFESERLRFYELFKQAPCSVGIFKGPHHVFEMANDLYLKLSGRNNIIGKTVREVFPEIENQGLFELLDSVYQTGKVFTANERLVQVRKGETNEVTDFYLNFAYQPYRNEQNEIEGVFFFAIDVTEQVQSRKKIEDSEKRFRELIQDLPEAIYTCDAEGRIMLYNKAAEELWGRKPEAGDRWNGAYKMYNVDGSFLPLEMGPMAQTLKYQKAIFTNDLIIERPEGDRRFVRDNPIPIFSDKKLVGAVNMLVDITHIKLVEEKLRTSNERYGIVSKATNDAIWDWNLITNEIYCNKSYERLFGYKKSNTKIDLKKWMLKIHPDDRDRVEKGIYDTINNGGKHWQDEYRYFKRDGTIAQIFDRGYLIYSEQKTPIRFVGAMQDITERKLVEEKLCEYQEQLLESQRIAHIGSWQMTFAGSHEIKINSILCSEETLRIFELPSGDREISYQTFSSLLHQDDRKLVEAAIEKAIIEKSTYSIDVRIITSDKSVRWVNQQAKVITDAGSGEILKMFGTIKDITVHKEQELKIRKNTEEREILIAELTKSITDLKQFSYITSHNLRAPLSNLVGLLSIIDYNSLDGNNRQILELFKSATHQLNKTINDLVQILIIKNNVNVHVSETNIPQILDEVCKALSYEINEFDCTIRRNLQVENIVFNKSYLESILINLLSNAIKYRSPERSLQIGISTETLLNGDVLVTFSDNGIGIDLDRHGNSIFGLYQRFHSNTDGAGLGLFMVKSQITALGGRIQVKSQVDKGTAFFITLKNKAMMALQTP